MRVSNVEYGGILTVANFILNECFKKLPPSFTDLTVELTPTLQPCILTSAGGELMGLLQNLSAELAKRRVALIVIDSMAMLARIEMSQDDIPKRQRMLAQQANLLKKAAEEFNLTVVTTNQVTAGFGDGTGQRAALGVLWSHCVNSRLVLEQRQGVRCTRVRPSATAPGY